MSHVTFFFFTIFLKSFFGGGNVGGTSQWIVNYQHGLTRQVTKPGVAGAVLQAPW